MSVQKPNARIHDLIHIKTLLRKSQSCCHDTLDYAYIYDLSDSLENNDFADKIQDVINHIQEIINDITF